MTRIIKPRAGDKVPALKSQFTPLGTRKSDQVVGVLTNNGSDAQIEDTFTGSYTTQGNLGSVAVIEPTFLPLQLKNLVTKNNILNQCVEAMEVNCDGTGHTIEKLMEDGPEDEAQQKLLEDFFAEPYPGKSMISIRRALRRDLEDTGWAVLECIRNVSGDLIMLNHLDVESIRLIRLDDPVFVAKTVTRAGKEMEVNIRARERRFVQMINGKKIYFKEFLASRELDRDTGVWADPGVTLPIGKRASEILYFTVNREVRTPYGSPRWINVLPSVMGSRRAEELNLDFFDAGGLPPVLVLVQGGYLGSDVKAALEAHLSGTGSKHRAAVVEAIAASGSLDSSGTVKVTVERFGAERQQDAMFMEYDKNCEEHVRTAFRLPPLFVGRAQDYNFATALTGYMVAEAQVFAPERTEFDERMQLVVRELGVKDYKFKSNPISLSDATNSIAAINDALIAKVVTPESAITEINKITGMHLESQKPPDPIAQVQTQVAAQTDGKLKVLDKQHEQSKEMTNISHDQTKELTGMGHDQAKEMTGISHDNTKENTQIGHDFAREQMQQQAAANDTPDNADQKKKKVSKSDVQELLHLADAWGSVLGLRGPCLFDDDRIESVKKSVNELRGERLHVFNDILATKTLVGVDATTEGIAQLCGAALSLIAEQ